MAPRRPLPLAEEALAGLVARLTDKQASALDQALLSELKGRCKASDDAVLAVWELLWDRLRTPHSQVRLLALSLAAELVQRSKVFRGQLAAQLTQVLELVVGFREGNPLPPPLPAAAALREKALELLERWAADHGAKHKQFVLGHSYLRDTLRMQFPEIDARAAARAAVERERQQQEQAAANARFRQLTCQEWEEGSAEAEQLLRQMDECFALAVEPALAAADAGHPGAEADAGPSSAALVVPAGAAEGADSAAEPDGLEWEDVAAEPEHGLEGGGEGEAGGALLPEAAQSAPADTLASSSDAVLETLHGCYLLLRNKALPMVQDWLRIIVRADDSQGSQRDQLLRRATDLKARLAAAEQRFLCLGLDLAALAERQRQREQQRRLQREQLEEQRRQQQQERANGGRPRPAPSLYSRIRDPAAPRAAQQQPAQQQQQKRRQGASEQPCRRAREPLLREPSLPDHVRQQLAAAAPVLPQGAYTQYWDTGAAAWAGGHGMEISNHWGPVDAHKELPKDRLDELFMYVPESAVRAFLQAGPPSQSAALSAVAQAPADTHTSTAAGTSRRSDARQAELAADRLAVPAVALARTSRAAVARAQERAYNEAVIGGAVTDEQLAHALAATTEPRTQPATKRRKASVRQRLEAKVRRAGRTAEAQRDEEEAEQLRDKNANRF